MLKIFKGYVLLFCGGLGACGDNACCVLNCAAVIHPPMED